MMSSSSSSAVPTMAKAKATAKAPLASADQVTIDVETFNGEMDTSKDKELLSAGFIAVDGRHSSHRSHGNHSSNHHHSGESDTDEKKHGRRHRSRRSRSRSRSRSPSNRSKRNTDTGVSHPRASHSVNLTELFSFIVIVFFVVNHFRRHTLTKT